MNKDKVQTSFFFILLAGVVMVNILIFFNFLTPILLAFVLAVICSPLHSFVKKKFGRFESVAAFFSTFLILIIVVAPLVYFGFALVDESLGLYRSSVDEGGPAKTLILFAEKIENFLPFEIAPFLRDLEISKYANESVGWLVDNLSIFATKIARGVLNLFLLILALFYFLRDGAKFKKYLIELSPLRDIHDNILIGKVESAVNSVIRGHIIIAIIQGALTGLGFFIFSVPNPIIWGFVAAIFSFVPSLGTSMIIFPAVIYLGFTSSIPGAIGLLIWGIVIVGLVDNLLGPILIQKGGLHVHPFLILISVLGAIHLFGIVGFILGPVVVGLLFALFEIYLILYKEKPVTK